MQLSVAWQHMRQIRAPQRRAEHRYDWDGQNGSAQEPAHSQQKRCADEEEARERIILAQIPFARFSKRDVTAKATAEDSRTSSCKQQRMHTCPLASV